LPDRVTHEEFKRMDIRVVKVLKAERIQGRTKILRAVIDIGNNELREVVVGGAEYYEPEYFVGKKMIAIVNLEEKVIAGVKSQAMLLAADDKGRPVWLIPAQDVPIGSRVI
jgi:methionine--tRNA ligase beta chain